MSKLYEKLIRPALFNFSPETAHEFGIEALKVGLGSRLAQNFAARKYASGVYSGELERFGLKFKNPLGIAAGFDKNGIVVNQLAALGFGFVEVGTVTFNPQKGNEKPRLFRLPEDRALINRLGFNNEGTPRVVKRLKKLKPNCILGVNIGKNKDVPNDAAIENYLKSFDLAHEVADYIAVNVSSPNTPNLRELQKAENLEELLGELQKRNEVLSRNASQLQITDYKLQKNQKSKIKNQKSLMPLLVKIAPDLSDAEIEAIVDIAERLNLAGIIATNTTVSRESLKTKTNETGGLSGAPVREKSNAVIRKIYKYSQGNLPIIGVGGVFSGADAFEKIACGASLVQAYTGFIYQGISFAHEVNAELTRILKDKGFKNPDEAIGSNN
jgi:dihydroorotate dehydrogenase